jgi:hypothetical protein
MNRRERRKRAKMMARETTFYESYVKHLPRVATDAPMEPGTVNHLIFFHDSWCGIYTGGTCTCDPIIERRAEPRRS